MDELGKWLSGKGWRESTEEEKEERRRNREQRSGLGGSSGQSSSSQNTSNPSKPKDELDELEEELNPGIPPDPVPELPKDGPSSTEEIVKETRYFGESKSADLGEYFTIEVGALEGQMPEISVDEEGNINVSIIVANVARVSFDVHNASQTRGLRIDVDCGKGVFELVANKSGVFIRAEADTVRLTGTIYFTASVGAHAEAGAFGGGIKFGKGGFGFTKPKLGGGIGFDYQVKSSK